jgi:hypothetical protein
VVDLGSGRLQRGGTTETDGGDRREDCSGELFAREYARAAREASQCPRGGARGWDITGSGRKKEPGAAASNGGRRCAARCPAATRTAGELRPLNRCSCLGEGVMVARAETTRVKAWAVGRWRRACVRPGYGGDAVGGLAQVGFARPVSVRRVATKDWALRSVRGFGTSGHGGVPAFVPSRSAAQPGARDVLRGLEPARFQFQVVLFKREFLQNFQLKCTKG